jgi:chemotaxis protein CheD
MNDPVPFESPRKVVPRETESLPERKVGMGEIAVVQGSYLLRTLLGSCIGVALYDSRRRIGGLAHIVLPNSNGNGALPGKYADTAIPELLRQMERLGGSLPHISAKLAGGSNMFAVSGPGSIGDQNRAVVDLLLKEARIPVLGRHCGGQQGRKMVLNVESGRVTVEIIGSPLVEL